MQCTSFMRPVTLSPVTCPALLYFLTLFHKRNDFRGKKLLNMKYVSIFSTTFVNIVSYSKNSTRYHLHVKYPRLQRLKLSRQISENFPIVKPTRRTNVSNVFILQWHSTCFGRSFRQSPGDQDCTYSNRHFSNRYCSLLASGYPQASWQQ